MVHALQHSTRAYIMETGSVVLKGASEELIDNDYIKERTWEFDLGAGKSLDRALNNLGRWVCREKISREPRKWGRNGA